tara:strand:+ start:465 stop:1214 length:750 start_codon:yes stop_codon:yes gene_type:complete
MNAIIKNLTLTIGILCSFVMSQVTGQFSSDISIGDSISFTSPYTGVVLTGEGWELSTKITDGVSIEEAKYSWSVTDVLTLTFGRQAEPYGIAWGLHRPSENSFVSLPREHSAYDGLGVSASVKGVGIQGFYGNDEYWAGRVSYGLFDHTVGVSVNSDEGRLVDVSGKASIAGFPIVSSLEYDLSEEADGAFWFRTVVTPDFAKGASLLLGYNSDDEALYGVGYKCSDKCFLSTELSAEGDKVLRISYSF